MTDTPSPTQPNTLSDLRGLRSMVEEVGASLRAQRDVLRARGMSLPPMVLQTIASIEQDLNDLEAFILNDQTELGQLRALTETSALMNSTLDVEEVLNAAMDVVINLTGAERGYIILRDDDGTLDYRVMVDTTRSGDQPIKPGEAPQISHSIVSDVLASGQPLLTDNAYKDARYQDNMSIVNLTLRSVLCVPLAYKGRIFGVVYVDNRVRTAVFEEREKQLLSAFANQAAVAFENARLFQQIQGALAEITEIKELTDNVFESIGSGVITTNARNRVQTVNSAARAILNRNEDTMLGQPLSTILPGVSADFDAHLAEVREGGAAQKIEAEMDVPGRGRIVVSMKLSRLLEATGDDDDEAQGVAVVLDDMTERRARDELLGSVRRYLPPQMVDNIHLISQLELGGERREVTCMYVNVYALAHLPPGLRPQQIMETMNRYLAVATDCIHAAEGIIDKYMGNVVMALFNTQLNPLFDDHASRALEAALAIRAGLAPLYGGTELGEERSGDQHFYRIGIHSGIATLGNVGSLRRREFTAIGDTINLAKRLEESARDGQIIISEAAYHRLTQIPHAARFEEREPVKVKGRAQFTRIYEVMQD